MKISRAQKEQSVRRDQHSRLVQGSLGNGSYQTEREAEVSALGQLRCVCVWVWVWSPTFVCSFLFLFFFCWLSLYKPSTQEPANQEVYRDTAGHSSPELSGSEPKVQLI